MKLEIPEETKKRWYEAWAKRARQAVYKLTPLSRLRKRPRKGESHCERPRTVDNGFICYDCHTVHRPKGTLETHKDYDLNKELKCPQCGCGDLRWIGPIARMPKKDASKKKWQIFFDKYCGLGHMKNGCR